MQKLDGGALCFLKYKGNILIKDLLTKPTEILLSEQSDLLIYPISMDNNIYKEIEKKKTGEEPAPANKTQLLQCLVGTRDGTIYIYDPLLISNAKILSFNGDTQVPYHKERRPDLVRWVEPVQTQVE